MCLLEMKTLEKRNEVNNTSSSGSLGRTTAPTLTQHTSAPSGPQAAGEDSITRGWEPANGRLQPGGDRAQGNGNC